MEQETNRARELGQEAGDASQGALPVLGDIIEGFWDGLILNSPDKPDGAYDIAYDLGSMVPDLVVTAWNFLAGFVEGLLG